MIKYSVAPYNFVSFPEKSEAAYKDMEELPCHNVYSDELLNGVITYEIEAKSPVIVSKGNDKNSNNRNDFFVNPEGKLTIPGNTIRGLTRTKAAILSMSNITNDIEDSQFLYRSFTDKSSISEYYKKKLGIHQDRGVVFINNVEAGYIYQKYKDVYYIIPAKRIKDKSYFAVKEEVLRKIAKNVTGINYMYRNEFYKRDEFYKNNMESAKNMVIQSFERKKENAAVKKFDKAVKKKVEDLFRKSIADEKNYIPYLKNNIYFKINDKGKIAYITDKNESEGLCKGAITSSEYMASKEAHYIIPEMNTEANEILIDNKFINAYKLDLTRNKRYSDKEHIKEDSKEDTKKYKKFEHYYIPEDIGIENAKPIFYAKFNTNGANEKRWYFGFTPYLRIFYEHSVRDGIKDSYKSSDGISFCDAIFGFTKNDINNERFNKNYKSRVSFCDATSEDKPAKYNEKENGVKLIPGEPKATCIQCYLKQDENDIEKIKSYNDCNFSIRGIKNYWIKDETDPDVSTNENVNITIYPAHKGVKFTGRIKFDNLKKEELGLLLWSLKISENAHDNIGMAKEYGFGNIEFENINLEIEDLNKKYKSINGFFSYMDKKDIKEYINYYKKFFKDKFKVDIDNEESVKELLMMKTNFIKKEDENNFRHMSIKKKEFRNRYPLPDVEDIIAKKCYKSVNADEHYKKPYNNNIIGNKKNSSNLSNRRNYSDNNKNFNNPFAEKLKNYKIEK